ncbi:MAG: tRNA (adenosine(37)-N6)-threonylcarbamoyltransferase complex dimerization subunit type 1 TsaB [Bacteroidetes bacterium GWB2_41_8]|nr:MAG: tRNA (adenosine(37)-N6)-threonylcarbamoyltransferase complex dimerization subunit type 1 TsaB [Bacteroidetes bacterium GWB2_41_8]
MAVILIIETSTEVCSVALTVDGKLIDLAESKEGQNHARQVTVFAQELMARNNIKPEGLAAVAVSKGPGSYTGLRIGVSTAKGICYARNIPLIAIGTLEAMTMHVMHNRTNYNIPENKPTLFCPMIDARRMEVYSMLFDDDGSVLSPISATIVDENFMAEELTQKQVVFFGNGSEKCRTVLISNNTLFISHLDASAKYMCELAWQLYNKKQFEDVAYFEPFYLKDFIATVSKKNLPG